MNRVSTAPHLAGAIELSEAIEAIDAERDKLLAALDDWLNRAALAGTSGTTINEAGTTIPLERSEQRMLKRALFASAATIKEAGGADTLSRDPLPADRAPGLSQDYAGLRDATPASPQDDASYRCEDGRRMRHDPMPDDPYLETDVGECPKCAGKGCHE